MLALIVGVICLYFTYLSARHEESDPLWFSSFMGLFDVTKKEHPYLFWFSITTQAFFSLGLITYGVIKLC